MKKWIAGCLAMFAGVETALAEYDLNMRPGVTTFSQDVYDLHMLIFYICVGIGIVVFGAMFISMFLHRKSRGAKPATFSHSTKAEIVWTVIPVLILVGMAVPATKVLIDMEQTNDAELTIKITGYQWKWRYEHIEDGLEYYSTLDAEHNAIRQLKSGRDPKAEAVENYLLEVDEPLIVPTNTKIRFLITAADVIHSWWVPDFGWKRDAIPGFVNEGWTMIPEPGTYRGQCAELCGKDHGFMPIVVKAVDQNEYLAWVAEKRGDGDQTLIAASAEDGAADAATTSL